MSPRIAGSRSLLGKGLAFPLRMDPVTNDFAQAEDESNIEGCLVSLLVTLPGERQDPRIGTIVPELPFETSDAVPDLAEPSIRSAIELFEPRVDLRSVHVSRFSPGDNVSGLRIGLRYRVVATGRPSNLVIPYLFEEKV